MKFVMGTGRLSGRKPRMRLRDGFRRSSWRLCAGLFAWIAAVPLCAWSVPVAAEDVQGERVEPEVIDVVYRRLVEQRRTLEAVVEIVERLEAIAGQAGAARELLSDAGEPTERLRRALHTVAGSRSPSTGEGPAGPGLDARPSENRTFRDIEVEVVYAQKTDHGGSVVIAARGAHYAIPVGRLVRIGDTAVEILGVARAGDALTVQLRMNGGAVVSKRVGG